MLYALMGLTDDQALLQRSTYILLLMPLLLLRSRSTSRFLNKMDIFRAAHAKKPTPTQDYCGDARDALQKGKTRPKMNFLKAKNKFEKSDRPYNFIKHKPLISEEYYYLYRYFIPTGQTKTI